MTGRVHDLKTWPKHFAAVQSGVKLFEACRDDRAFAVGDLLRLHEFDPSVPPFGRHTGQVLTVRVAYVLHGGEFGIEPGHVVMSISRENQP